MTCSTIRNLQGRIKLGLVAAAIAVASVAATPSRSSTAAPLNGVQLPPGDCGGITSTSSVICGEVSCSSCATAQDCNGNVCLTCVTFVEPGDDGGVTFFVDSLGDC